MLTILPRRCASIAGNTARQDRNMPRRLTAMTRSHSSIGISSQERRGSTLISEALLMRTSIAPKRSSAACAMAFVDSSLAMSVARPMVSKPCAASASATDFAAVPSMSHDAGPRLGEFLRIDFADPFAAAGDDDGAAGQIKALVHGAASMGQARTHAFGAQPSRARAGSSKPGMTYHRPLLRAFDLDL